MTRLKFTGMNPGDIPAASTDGPLGPRDQPTSAGHGDRQVDLQPAGPRD